MIYTIKAKVRSLKQLKTALSFQISNGELVLELFDEKGIKLKDCIDSNIKLNENVNTSIRLNAKQLRTVKCKSPFEIFLEVGSGPF